MSKRKHSDIHTSITCGVLGKGGSFSEQAATDYFAGESRSVTIQNFESLAKIFSCVENGECKYGVVPMENSDSGSFRATYDLLLANKKIHIWGEYIAKEEHCLVALPGVKKSDITEILSHPSALDMCDRFLNAMEKENKCSLSRVAVSDTATGCLALVNDKKKTAAAIASKNCAKHHNLEVLESPISNDKHIQTRYIILSNEPNSITAEANQIKGTLCLSVKNKPGSFFKALSCFAFRDINVLSFNVRPSSKALDMFDHSQHWDLIYFLEYEPSADQQANENLLTSLKEYCITVRKLGTYRKHAFSGQQEYTLLYQ